jgi:hypothetical protein
VEEVSIQELQDTDIIKVKYTNGNIHQTQKLIIAMTHMKLLHITQDIMSQNTIIIKPTDLDGNILVPQASLIIPT